MKKQATKGIIILLLVILFVPIVGFAQDSDDRNIVTAVTMKSAFPEGGSVAEFDSLYAALDKNVVSKNKFVKSVMRVGHLYGASSGDFVVITEYNGSGLEVLDDAAEEGSKLFKKWKSEKEDRAEFNKAMNKYFKDTHSDEIYTLWSKVSK